MCRLYRLLQFTNCHIYITLYRANCCYIDNDCHCCGVHCVCSSYYTGSDGLLYSRQCRADAVEHHPGPTMYGRDVRQVSETDQSFLPLHVVGGTTGNVGNLGKVRGRETEI